MIKLLQIFAILFGTYYTLTFAILAILQASIEQCSLALQDMTWMTLSACFGALLHKLLGYYRSKKHGKQKNKNRPLLS